MIYTNFELEELLTAAGYEVERKGTTICVSSNNVNILTIYNNGCGKVLLWFRPVVVMEYHGWNGKVSLNNDIYPEHNIFWNNERYAKYKETILNHCYLGKAWSKSCTSQINRFALRETHFNPFINELVAFAPTLIEHVKEAYKNYKRYITEKNLDRFHSALKE